MGSDPDKRQPDWQISQLLTLHAADLGNRPDATCAVVIDLRQSQQEKLPPHARLERARQVDCTCGAGHDPQPDPRTYDQLIKDGEVPPEDPLDV